MKEIRSAHGGTVNDVLLAAITSGFRDLLDARGELADGLVVRSLVPVSVRRQDEQGMITNRVSAVLANLPAGEPDPLRRLELIRGQMDELKQHLPGRRRGSTDRDAGLRGPCAARPAAHTPPSRSRSPWSRP